MTPEQTAEIMVKAKDSFQKWKDIDKYEFAMMIKTWHEVLEDMPYEMAKKSMIDYIRDNQYPPTPADIRKPLREYQEKQKELKREYNDIYQNAIAYYPCYQDTREERAEFDRITGKSVSKAMKLSRKIEEYVRSKEINHGCLPTLINYLKGVEKIE